MSDASNKNQPKLDCQAKKMVVRLGRAAVNRLREKFPEATEREMGGWSARIDEMIAAKAFELAMDKPKMIMSVGYPIEAFLAPEDTAETGDRQARADFIAALPATIELKEFWLPFADGSMLMIATPSEETIACGRFLSELVTNPTAQKLLGIDELGLRKVQEIVGLGVAKKRLLPMNKMELEAWVGAKQRQRLAGGVNASVWVNLSREPISMRTAMGVLLDFVQAPNNSTKNAVDSLIENASMSKGSSLPR